jgi:predicted DNA-binding transcriptional regulator AlpA
MVGRGAKFSRKKEEAIAALLVQRNVEEAARAAGLSPQTLYRWMKIPEFSAEYREARRASVGHAFARLQKASGAAVTILLKVVYDASAPRSVRLKAADRVLSCTKGTSRMEEIGARLWALKQGKQASLPEPPENRGGAADAGRSARAPGHGAKFGRKKEEAIAALLTQQNVEEAARVAGIGTMTLYRWIKDPEFAAEYREARLTAFGQAGVRLQQASGLAATVILRIMIDPAAPARSQVAAAHLVIKHGLNASEEDIENWLAELKGARQAAPVFGTGGSRTIPEIARERPRVTA